MYSDLRYASRLLTRNPALTVAAVITLALGIGANSAIFSLVNAFLLRPLPYEKAERLVHLFQTDRQRGWNQMRFSIPEYLEIARRAGSFEELAAYDYILGNLSGEGEPERVHLGRISANLLTTLGVEPSLGRGLRPGDDQPGAGDVMLLSHRLWQRRFAADPGILGRTVRLDGQPYTVIGVLPPGFNFPYPEIKVWIPLHLDPDGAAAGYRRYQILGRLAPGVSRRTAEQATGLVHRQVQDALLGTDRDRDLGLRIVPLREALTFSFDLVRLVGLILAAAVGFVLLIACANVANLLLARASARETEIAVRSAVGAPRRRLIRQFLTESSLLALVGGALGVLLALWAVRALAPLIPEDLYRVGEIGIDGQTLAFTLGLSLLTALIFGLAPALATSRPDLCESLGQTGGHGGGGLRGGRLRNLLVVLQLALALVLLISAALMIRSFRSIQEVDPGIEAAGVLTLGLSLPRSEYPERAQVVEFYDRVLRRLEALPGVEAAATVYPLPLSFDYSTTDFEVEGRPASDERLFAEEFTVSRHYFTAMGIPLLRGRGFAPADDETAPGAVVVGATLARRLWPEADPVGQRLRLPASEGRETATVVGVVGDVRHRGLHEPVLPQIYRAHRQQPLSGGSVVLRTASNPLLLAGAVRQAIWAVDPNVPVSEVRTMDQVLSTSLLAWRISGGLLSVLAVSSLVLAATGLYGLMAYAVTRRRQEIAVRMAIGARARDVLRSVVIQGLKLALAGIVLGVPAALALSRLLGSMIYGISSINWTTVLGIPMLLTAVALLAIWLPARRASRIEPMAALRQG